MASTIEYTYDIDFAGPWLGRLAAGDYKPKRFIAAGDPTGSLSLTFDSANKCELSIESTGYHFMIGPGDPTGTALFVGCLYNRPPLFGHDNIHGFDLYMPVTDNKHGDDYSFRVFVRGNVATRRSLVSKLRTGGAMVKEFDYLDEVSCTLFDSTGQGNSHDMATLRLYKDSSDDTVKFHLEDKRGATIYLANAHGLSVGVRNPHDLARRKVCFRVAENATKQVEITRPNITLIGFSFNADLHALSQALRNAGVVVTIGGGR